MADRKLYNGDAAIGRAIKSLDGKIANLMNTVSDIAVSIIAHAAGDGNGDVSRALELCKVVAKHKSMNVAFLVGFFRYFGRTNVNLRANDGAGSVSLIKPDAKGYRPFDVVGAKHNNWYEAVDNDGNRADWYAGPVPQDYEPQTIGDFAASLDRFVKRATDQLEGEKEVRGKKVPIYQMSDDDRVQAENALAFVRRIAATLARHENVNELQEKLEEERKAAAADKEVIGVIEARKAAA
jgi:hypothetical protein